MALICRCGLQILLTGFVSSDFARNTSAPCACYSRNLDEGILKKEKLIIILNVKNFPDTVKQFRVLDPSLSMLQVSRGSCALAVMTKAPHPGRVKTRLVPPLTPEEAAELNKCFLRDTAATISNACSRCLACPAGSALATARAKGIAVYTPVGAESVYAGILPPNFILLPQRGDEFGERLYFAVEDLFKCGFESVCLIDSDSPTVPAANFEHAMQVLTALGDGVILGPSEDGGYYLIGLKKLDRRLFEQIDWSTERVLDQTIQRANEIGLEVTLLPTGYDVDDAVSLRRLCSELLADTTSADIAPCTREFLAKLTEHKNSSGALQALA